MAVHPAPSQLSHLNVRRSINNVYEQSLGFEDLFAQLVHAFLLASFEVGPEQSQIFLPIALQPVPSFPQATDRSVLAGFSC